MLGPAPGQNQQVPMPPLRFAVRAWAGSAATAVELRDGLLVPYAGAEGGLPPLPGTLAAGWRRRPPAGVAVRIAGPFLAPLGGYPLARRFVAAGGRGTPPAAACAVWSERPMPEDARGVAEWFGAARRFRPEHLEELP